MMSKIARIFKGVLSMGDMFCLALSPIASVGFVIFLIILASGWGGHLSLIHQYETGGRTTTARILYDPDPDSDYLFLDYNGAAGAPESGFIRTRYFKAETIAKYQQGQFLQVYYLPEKVEHEVIPVADFAEFRQYRGYWQDIWIPLLISYVIMIVHPEWLYLGLLKTGRKA
ncbi:MAG TPA: hypothetical protein PKG95_00490 [Anaerolineaceae bacterium]|nr:hypothetical protein [Anaerolineaceae bacterium]